MARRPSNRVPQSHPPFRTDIYEKPRQLLNSLLAFTLLSLIPSYFSTPKSDQEAVGQVIWAIFGAFQLFVFLQVRDMITVWPHAGFWRLVFGAGAFYAIFIVAMLMLDFTRARWLFASVVPSLGTWSDYIKKLDAYEGGKEDICTVSVQTLMRQIVFQPWFLSHALGWMGKMMIFRDWKVCLVAALFFEFTELTFTYVVPEFEECWWDSVFLDTFGANLLGMWMGTHVNRWIEGFSSSREVEDAMNKKDDDRKESSPGKSFKLTASSVGTRLDWSGQEHLNSIEKVMNSISPVNPAFLPQYKWRIFSSPLRLIQVMVLIGVMLFIETNTFLMMNTMGIPHDSAFNKFRLALFGFLSIPAAAEWYLYVETTNRIGSDVARIGPACWLCFCVAILENCLFWKFFPGHFVKTIDRVKIENWTGIPMPMDILVKHVLACSLFGIWFFLRYKVMPREELLADVDKEDAELVNRLVSEQKKNKLKGRRKQSLVDMFPLKIRQKAMMYDLVDVFLVVALVPLLMLGENWAGLPSWRG
mmetsp:Transcript_1463/g.2644  ORF Transcript_1463/g.2644 Transcript_1463/m.2644 type:complete len:530 (-) Transcript_1463:23-1612(-)|eukprot:CAMPEP_0182466824 /NCGR_PEP_ID=MMETSP1319-20130603/12685_1 /TAXON_ID=172717 /ORGANISM="Bolidomonas pacifica, Strain RCC208" /LENGTH=529 /DNA_ID=CAMNT_0024666859 /DNA_START=215 /DNA_END=1804 /DNA_ORIENTATION=-